MVEEGLLMNAPTTFFRMGSIALRPAFVRFRLVISEIVRLSCCWLSMRRVAARSYESRDASRFPRVESTSRLADSTASV